MTPRDFLYSVMLEHVDRQQDRWATRRVSGQRQARREGLPVCGTLSSQGSDFKTARVPLLQRKQMRFHLEVPVPEQVLLRLGGSSACQCFVFLNQSPLSWAQSLPQTVSSALRGSVRVTCKLHKKMLTKEEVHGMLNIASKTKPSSGLFRNLGDYELPSARVEEYRSLSLAPMAGIPKWFSALLVPVLSSETPRILTFPINPREAGQRLLHPLDGGPELSEGPAGGWGSGIREARLSSPLCSWLTITAPHLGLGTEMKFFDPFEQQPNSSLFLSTHHDKGLISYTEYLFLLTILTKPHTGFQIAFKMLDVDGNEHVDRREFLKLKNIISKRKEAKPPKDDAELLAGCWWQCGAELGQTGAFFFLQKSGAEVGDEVYTTLQAYFFGRTGNQKLQYKDFCRFMEDLQAEVQEMEFLQFSKGMDTMRREDFAEWLLHYTNEENNEAYWENMRKRIPPGQSITFEEFKSFCLFTNNIEDFAFTVKMISETNRPIGMAEFKRAVSIATGHKLSENVLDTVFKIFDLDGDNCLSHKEFLGVMKDRILRGLKVS
ncbi:MICU2 protein, partial [Atractosteus spatula]|nr:MICU2 protein [Atractosteus spatula]